MRSTGRSVLVTIGLAFLVSTTNYVNAITNDDLYTFGHGLDSQLPNGDNASTVEIPLRVPIVLYGRSYDSVYVNNFGLLSFTTDVPAFFNTQLPLDCPVIAPFYTNIDTRNSGAIYYRETQDAYIIAKATEDVTLNFADHPNFQATSVFVASWIDVGYYPMASDKVNTFQVVVISNGAESFVEFLYPENGIQWIQGSPQAKGLPDVRAQAGFASDDGRFYIIKGSGTDQIRKITTMSNTGYPGKFIFNVGNIEDDGNVEQPMGEDADEYNTAPDSCATGGSLQCHMRAQCIDRANGFCCECIPGYFGNGKSCLKDDVPLRVHGRVLAELNGEMVEPIELQAYIVMSDGRSYTALLKVPERFGYDFQTLNVLGGVIGWLFARPIGNAKNGYQLTGGVFNHTAEILFRDSGHKVTIRQQYLGLDLYDQLRMEAEIKGSIPKIPPGTKLDISEYDEQYSVSQPGIVLSHSSRVFRNKDMLLKYPFEIDQSIQYEVCPFLGREELIGSPLILKVAKNFIGYESRERIIRYGMSSKITPFGQEDPCVKGRETCGHQSSCIIEGDSFRCVCNPGYQYIQSYGNDPICVDINECSTGTHTCDSKAQCTNQEGSFSCRCIEGYEGNGVECHKVSACSRHTCDINAQCFESYDTPYCRCNEGFSGNGDRCWPISDAGCDVLENCSPYAGCNEIDGVFTCQCEDGYTGDGLTCYPETTTPYSHINEDVRDATCFLGYCRCFDGWMLEGKKCYKEYIPPTTSEAYYEEYDTELPCNAVNRCHPYAQCVLTTNTGQYQCQCTAGYEGNGIECTEVEVSCTEHDICDLHARCAYDPAISKSICVCNTGYHGDGHVCHSVADCQSSADCEDNAECLYVTDSNVPRHTCVCVDGFSKDHNDACVRDGGNCNGAVCSEHATCKWDPDYSIHYCACNSGYQANEINECELESTGCNIDNDCGLNADCIRDEFSNSYRCACMAGFYGDGYECASESTCQYNSSMCSSAADCVERNHEFKCECRPGYTGNGESCRKASKHEGNFLLLNQGMATLKVPFHPTPQNPGKPIHISYYQMAIGLDIDCAEGRLYWSDITGKEIKSAFYNGSGIENFLTQDVISPEGISIDWISRNIFWTDSRRDTIEVANIETKVRKTLFNTGLVDPRGIAVHPYRGKVFWSDWNRNDPKIEWSNMDGSDRKVFLDKKNVFLPNSLAIDWSTDELCYADAGTKSIECVQIDNMAKRTIAVNCSYPFGLAISETHYYWTDWLTQKIESLDKQTRSERKSLSVPLGGSGNKLYGMAAVPEQCRPLSNVCQYDNGKCPNTHLCLLDGNYGKKCVCGKPPVGPDMCNDQ